MSFIASVYHGSPNLHEQHDAAQFGTWLQALGMHVKYIHSLAAHMMLPGCVLLGGKLRTLCVESAFWVPKVVVAMIRRHRVVAGLMSRVPTVIVRCVRQGYQQHLMP